MCGIAGIISSGNYVADDMRRMLDVMRHRGPDDEGIYESDSALLGQRRLSIIDLAGGHQPIANEDKTLWLICNGEIYNYQSLKKDLEGRGHRFRTASDSEVILHLFEEYGDACLQHLRGMFAFVIWDTKNRTAFGARDRLGQKPLYYSTRNNELILASEIKSLLAFDRNLAVMDEEALDQYLSLRIITPPRSMFKQIRKLPPAHAFRYKSGEPIKIWRYWELPYEPKYQGNENDLVDELEERLIDCMKLHMVSDVPVGAFLSGGLDSTLVVAMVMQHVSAAPIKTFSFGLPYGQYDETPYARMVAERYGTSHNEWVMTPSLAENLPKLLWHLDEPSDPLSVCAYLISAKASEQVKVVLGGDGGDELFGGYDRYYGNRYANYYAMLPQPIRKLLIEPMLNLIPDGGWYKSKAHQLKWLHQLSFMSGSERYARSLSYFYFTPDKKAGLYGQRLAQTLKEFDAESAIREPYDNAMAKDIVDRMLYSDSCVRMPDHPVMITDRMTMAHSLEARSPLMDHEIAEFAARLPANMKVRGRGLRYIQYRLAERYLPKEVIARPKQGFSSSLPYLLRDEYKHLYKLFLRDSHLAKEGYLQQAAIDNILDEHESCRVDHGNRLWLLVNSESWYRMFMEGMSQEEMHSMITQSMASKS